METIVFKVSYLIWFVASFIIRYPYLKTSKETKIASVKEVTSDKILLFFTFLGMNLIPLIYIFTPFLDFANYQLPTWLGVLGVFIGFFGIWLFYLSHRDLGKQWSVQLEIREEHKLISDGIYKYVRHPMYSAIWLVVIGQALLLQNFIAGLAGLVTFGSLYFLRVFKEEEMMVKTFGDEYLEYSKKTGRIFPKNIFDILAEE